MNSIEKAIDQLNQDNVIGIPTETVYGLAGKIDSETAINRIFETKERPFFDPLIVHTHSIDEARKLTKNWDHISDILAKKFWPGSMTLIMKKDRSINPLITSGLETIGIRIPNHTLTLELLEKIQIPLAAPSANKFKKTSPTNAKHVQTEFPELFVLDGGECQVGIESTIVEVTDKAVHILRPGMIHRSDIEKELKRNDIHMPVLITESSIAPGHLKHHYMPKRPLIVTTLDSNLENIPKELLINSARVTLNDNPNLTARSLYSLMRELDTSSSSIIFEIKKEYLGMESWAGIINRLEKAATYFLAK